MEQDNFAIDEIEPSWKKVERDMTKVGLKNGLSDGREVNFQSSFDKGYEDGFRNGFNLGKLKFKWDFSQKSTAALTNENLANANKGLCVVCTTEKDNDNVANIRKKQTDIVTSVYEKIKKDLI